MEHPWVRPKEATDRYRATVHLMTAVQDGLDQWLRGWLPRNDFNDLAAALVKLADFLTAKKE